MLRSAIRLTSNISISGITTGGPPSTELLWAARTLSSGTETIPSCSILPKSARQQTNCANNMQPPIKWYYSPRMWLELFALFNLAGLVPDIFLAHSTNFFRHRTEYIPLIFSMISPIALIPAVVLLAKGKLRWWKILGYVVGWTSVLIGVAGLVLHLRSQFFQLWTLASLVYAAPFAAPLAYTGIGFLLIMNRMVDA